MLADDSGRLNMTLWKRSTENETEKQYLGNKEYPKVFFSVSDPYSLNPDTDPTKNLNPDPEGPWIRIQAIS